MAITACGSSSSSTGTNASSHSSAGFALQIGDLMPYTGELSAYGPSFTAATELAAKYLNEQLATDGLSKRYSVKIVDSQDEGSAATPAAEGATKLVEVDKVNMIDGPLNSGAALAVAQSISIPHEILQVSPTASSNALTKLSGHLVFTMDPTNGFIAEELLAAVKDQLGTKITINVGWSDDASEVEVSKLFLSEWKKAGGSVGKTVEWSPQSTTYDTEATKLVAGKPDAWVILTFPEEFEKLGPALVRTGEWSPARTFLSPEMREAAVLKKLGPQVVSGLRGVSPAIGETALQKSWTALFEKEEPGKTVTGYETFAFDSVVAPFLAAVKAGSNSGPAIAKDMQSVTNPPGKEYTYSTLAEAIKAVAAGKEIYYHGVSGPLDLGEDGAPTSGAFDLWKAQSNGEIQTAKVFTKLP
ncbi:MAG: ABC transporter substrate-binding protein [Solirubrobacteraceae bacterium]